MFETTSCTKTKSYLKMLLYNYNFGCFISFFVTISSRTLYILTVHFLYFQMRLYQDEND